MPKKNEIFISFMDDLPENKNISNSGFNITKENNKNDDDDR